MKFMKGRIGEMKVIHIVLFVAGLFLVAQSFLTACPTAWGLLEQEKKQVEEFYEDYFQAEKV